MVALDPVEQLLDAEVLRADAVERADRAASTWYRPLCRPDRSIIAASFGSSTTQSTVRSRDSSRQTRQRSPSATLPHSRQNEMRSFAWTIAAASRLASSAGVFTNQNASRCADFGPMPGNRASSSISSWIGPSYTR